MLLVNFMLCGVCGGICVTSVPLGEKWWEENESSENLMIPLQNHGIKCMSMGFLVEESAPVVWRGLMVMPAIEKLVPVPGVRWSPLDVLVVVKGAEMFRKTQVPLLGCVLNMSFLLFICPSCGTKSQIGHSFQSLMLMDTCQDMEMLAEVPFQTSIAEAANAGTPIMLSQPDSPHAIEIKELAATVLSKLDIKNRTCKHLAKTPSTS